MSTIGRASGRPPTSRPALSCTAPPWITLTSHDVPPMSKHSRSGSSQRSASSAAAAAPPAGPLSTVSAAWAAATSTSASPPLDCMIAGVGQPGLLGAFQQPPQVGGQQRRQRGVDLGGRRALVLAERAHGLVRERDVHAVAEALASARRARPARARDGDRRAAGRRRPPRARSPPPRRPARAPRRPRARAARRPAPSARARRSGARAGRAAPGARRTGGRARGGPGGRARPRR